MRNFFKPVAAYLLLILSASCSSGGSGVKLSDSALPKPGIIHEKIVCSSDQNRSYALFVPGTTTAPPLTPPQAGRGTGRNRLYPVIIVFDPHGDGVLPLKKYQVLAEKYGFILVGSNDSKNGLPAEDIKGIVTALMLDVRTIYPVDTNRIFLLGFSGGARVAAMAALYQTPVKGVIGCGAGFGSAEQPIRFKFDYFGIAGTGDFNMDEMMQLDEPLTRAGFRHVITTFPGIHAWPPVETMEDAFCWITLNSMKDGVLKKDDQFISGVSSLFDHRINELKNNNQLITAADVCREAISFMDGLMPTDKFKAEQTSIENQPAYQSQLAYRQKIQKQEGEEKQELMQALQSRDLAWWRKKIANYELRMTNDKLKRSRVNAEDTLKDRRLMAFLSLFCYMNANAALAQQDQNAALKIIAIYEMADSANPEPNYMRAVLLARRSENEAAIAQLKISISKGFEDKKRLTGQPEFTPLNSSPAWFDLLKTLK